MKYEITTERDAYNDLSATYTKTLKTISSDESLILEFYAMKCRGAITVRASVSEYKNKIDDVFTSKTHIMFQDYSKTVHTVKCARVTEKKLIETLQDALAVRLDDVMIEVKEQYGL